MNECRDILDRITRFIDECGREAERLDDGDDFTSLMAYKAVALDLAQIGESVNSLRKKYPEILTTEPDIPWGDIIGLRNIIVHNYDGIIRDEIKESLRENLPALKSAVGRLRAS
ncbi:MAG: DUF86 domain-containing protein [Clostridiales Family XIII bacterium]|jgi:uncharacterized protein with HEPN domain|nr:DUF86 domain-containing protein [Clostridiales Family XIII bacterium]